jgi:hypothetical protein
MRLVASEGLRRPSIGNDREWNRYAAAHVR